ELSIPRPHDDDVQHARHPHLTSVGIRLNPDPSPTLDPLNKSPASWTILPVTVPPLSTLSTKNPMMLTTVSWNVPLVRLMESNSAGLNSATGTIRGLIGAHPGAQLLMTFPPLHVAFGSCEIRLSTPCLVGPCLLPGSVVSC